MTTTFRTLSTSPTTTHTHHTHTHHTHTLAHSPFLDVVHAPLLCCRVSARLTAQLLAAFSPGFPARLASLAFVKGEKKFRFKNLVTNNLRGQPPRLFMLDEEGNELEELNVESWNTDSLEEYLEERLIDPSPAEEE